MRKWTYTTAHPLSNGFLQKSKYNQYTNEEIQTSLVITVKTSEKYKYACIMKKDRRFRGAEISNTCPFSFPPEWRHSVGRRLRRSWLTSGEHSTSSSSSFYYYSIYYIYFFFSSSSSSAVVGCCSIIIIIIILHIFIFFLFLLLWYCSRVVFLDNYFMINSNTGNNN